MNSIKVTAPAKVNLFLKVLGRRKDSYHNILTVFERITLVDKIKLSKAPKGITVSSDKSITRDPEDNLVYKAARLIMRKSKIKTGVRIRIRKRIPMGGGLGGGSSDAASTLIGINRLFRLGLGARQLMRLGVKIGADVPFFILDAPFAVGAGRGERLKKIRSGLKLWHVIIYPGIKLSTRAIYNEYDKKHENLTPVYGNGRIQPPTRGFGSFDTVRSMMHNDLGEIAVLKNGLLGVIIERLANSSGSRAIVSGSGSSVFCLCRGRKEAISAKRKFLRAIPAGKRRSWQIVVAGTGM